MYIYRERERETYTHSVQYSALCPTAAAPPAPRTRSPQSAPSPWKSGGKNLVVSVKAQTYHVKLVSLNVKELTDEPLRQDSLSPL